MCRIAAYFGPPVPLSIVVDDAPHALTDQSRNAREMADGTVAGDGWGIAWIPPHDPEHPGILKSILPLWSDENARNVPRGISASSFVGHARFASPNIEVCLTNTPIYPLGRHIWTVNGELKPWPGELSRRLRSMLHPEDEAAVRGSTDAEMLGALWRTCLRRVGLDREDLALREALAAARDSARALGGSVHVNAIVADSDGLFAVRFADSSEPPSLYTLNHSERRPGVVLIASEAFDDDPAWRPVPPSSLVVADARGLRIEPLDLPKHALVRASA